MFMRVGRTGTSDADREGLAGFLLQRGLAVAPSSDSTHHLISDDGYLAFDGYQSDLHLDPLDQEKPVSGGIWHAHLSDEECAFIYDLCVAGRMLIVNPQGNPLLIVPGHNHTPAELPDDVDVNDIAWIDSSSELAQVLSTGFAAFLEFKNRVIGASGDA
ncbi:hypothetical protein BH10ACT7_BH10ACT7_15240 [soil metagenome]